MDRLATALDRARALEIGELADAIQRIGFSCTRCGECCRGSSDDAHTATVYPDRVRSLSRTHDLEWRDVARPMPYGLDDEEAGETFEWAVQIDACGDCTFLETRPDGRTACTVYGERPALCRTYPFQVDLAGSTAPEAELADREGSVLAYECEGLGADIDRAEALELAEELKTRTIRDIEEARALLGRYEPAHPSAGTVVHDSEGPKRPDGRPLDASEGESSGRQY